MSVDIKSIAEKNIGNRVARVFVSSTFRDMRAERKYLMESIFPDIKRHCKRLGIEFVPIDLRWGISDEQARRGETLERIFSSIDDSRPFFICLLGNSYGSILPPIDFVTFSDDFSKRHLLVRDYLKQKRSYTDAEIRHGALDLDESSRGIINFHCWLRDENVKILVKVDETDNEIVESTPDNLRKLDELKSEINYKWKSECDIYTSVGDQNDETDLYKLVDREILKWIIKRFLKEDLPSDEKNLTWEYAYALHQNPTWLENQDYEQDVFERSRTRIYVHDMKRYKILYDFIMPSESDSVKLGSAGGASYEIKGTPRSKVLAITGKSGAGKSSLLANWVQKYTGDHKDDRPDDLILTHYVSASEGSEYPVNILFRFMEKLLLELQNTSSRNQQVDNILQRFKEKSNQLLLHSQSNEPSDALILARYVFARKESESPSNILRRFMEKKELELKNTLMQNQQDGNIPFQRRKPNQLLPQSQSKECYSDESNILESLKEEFVLTVSAWLSISNKRRLILIIDGLNQLSEENNDYKDLVWLPPLPDRVKLILSTVEDDEKTCDAIRRRGWDHKEIELLNYEQKKGIVNRILEDRSKEDSLTDDQKRRICDAQVTENSLVLRVLLDELCYVGNYQDLDGEIDFYLAQEDGKEVSEVGFLKRVLERLEKRLAWLNGQPNVAVSLACLLSASRYGLTEEELEKASGLNQFEVSMFLGALDSHLTNRSGRYSFSHKFIERAVNDKYGSEHIKEARESLIEYFLKTFNLFKEHLSDEDYREYLVRSCVEVPYQLRELGEWNRLYEFLLDFDVFDELYDEEVTSDFCLYWNDLLCPENGGYKFGGYLELDDSCYDDAKKALLWHKLGRIAYTYNTYELSEKAYNKSLLIHRALAKNSPEVYNPDVAMTLNNLGNLHRDMGSYSEAASEFEESLDLYRALVKKNPEVYNPFVATTLNNLGNLHQTLGSYSEAASEFEESLDLYRALAKKNPNVYNSYVASTLNSLGTLHRDIGSYSESESEFEESLDLYRALAKKNPNVYNSYVASTLNNLGNLHRDIGSYSESESEFEESLDLYRALAKKNPNVYNSYVASTLNSLGTLHRDIGSYSESESEFEESLDLYRALAKKNPNVYNSYVASTLNSLGTLHRDIGSYSESESEFEESLGLYRALAKKNPVVYDSNVATTLNNLGNLHRDMGSYSESESELTESLTLYRELAKKFPDVYNSFVAATLDSLGFLHQTIHSYLEAATEYEESLGLYRVLAKKNPDVYDSNVAAMLTNLGTLHRDIGSYSEAASEIEESLDLYRALAKKNPNVYNPYVAMTLNNLGILHSDMGSLSESESELAKCLTLYRALAKKSPEVYNPEVAKTLNNLGVLHKMTGSYSEAVSEFEESLDLCRALAKKSPEVYNPEVARTLYNLGNLHRDMGSYSESESEYAESLTIYRTLASKDPEVYNPNVATMLSVLGTLHQETGSYPAAESEFEEGLKIFRAFASKAPEVYNPNVADTLDDLGFLHQTMNSYPQAESNYEESLAIRRDLASKNPEVYNPDVAATLFKLVLFYYQTERYNLAKEKLLEYVKLYEQLPEAIRSSQVKQFEFALGLLAEIRKIEEEQ